MEDSLQICFAACRISMECFMVYLNKDLYYVLGNHILPDEDLASFHWSLLGPEHPLASLKVQI